MAHKRFLPPWQGFKKGKKAPDKFPYRKEGLDKYIAMFLLLQKWERLKIKPAHREREKDWRSLPQGPDNLGSTSGRRRDSYVMTTAYGENFPRLVDSRPEILFDPIK